MHIDITDLSKVYRGGATALNNLTLSVADGLFGLLGSNGAGKTTLMRVLCGILPASSGQVVIDGHDLSTAAGARAVKQSLGYLPQDLQLYPDLTGREFLDYIGLLKGLDDDRARREQIQQLLEQVALNDDAGRRTREYSGGMKRRLGIAQALLGNPRLVIVDEPTAGLDPEERIRFRTLLASLGAGRTVILSTHILDDVSQTCPEVAVLSHGQLVYRGPTLGLAEEARGKVTTVLTPGPPPAGDHTVISAITAAEGTWYRLISDAPPPGSIAATPTLEDGYVVLMHTLRDVPPFKARIS
ncbi:MAG: type transport system ATP-binding protein [Actinomycetota bacterium]|nr:type transport system ATP-binding protein [Actinomycetota bacterium]